jgi:hypothetical protein
MAIIFPVYQRVRNVTLEDYGFDSGDNPTDLIGLDLGSAASPLTSGLLWGVSVTLQDNAGPAASDYSIELFSENSGDLDRGTSSVLYSATFSFAAVERTISDMLSQPVPILEQPFVRVRQTTTETDEHDILIKFYIQAIAN